jgi:hypothetical protein
MTLVSGFELLVGGQADNRTALTAHAAIWDNRSVFHTATFDYLDGNYGERFGNRAVGLGERPYLDPNSTSRRTALNQS